MATTPAFRSTVRTFCGILMGMTFWCARLALAQSGNWSAEVIELEPISPSITRPVVVAVALDPSGRQVAIAGDDHVIRIWDLQRRQRIRYLVGHTDWVRSLCYAPDGGQLASAGNDGRILVWQDGSSRPSRELLRCDHGLSALAFRPGTSQLASVGFQEPLRLFDAATGVPGRQLKCPCIDMRAIAFSPRGDLVAGGGRNGKIRIWDVATGDVLRDEVAHRQRIRDLSFSLDGQRLASCGEDRRVRVASIDGRSEIMLPPAGCKVMAVAFLGNNRLAIGGSDNAIRIWDLATQQEVERLTGHTGSVMALAYRGGTLVSAGFDATVRVWGPHVNTSAGSAGATASGAFEVR